MLPNCIYACKITSQPIKLIKPNYSVESKEVVAFQRVRALRMINGTHLKICSRWFFFGFSTGTDGIDRQKNLINWYTYEVVRRLLFAISKIYLAISHARSSHSNRMVESANTKRIKKMLNSFAHSTSAHPMFVL